MIDMITKGSEARASFMFFLQPARAACLLIKSRLTHITFDTPSEITQIQAYSYSNITTTTEWRWRSARRKNRPQAKLGPHPPISSRALCGSRRRSESERVSTRGSVAAPQRDSSTHHTPHKATPRPAAPHPLAALAALAAASPHSYYRSPRPGLPISHRARRPLVPGAHACGSSPHMPRQTMVVSDELPKAPSKESWKK